MTINVAGTTSQVEAAFHTTIANYREGSRYFYANSGNPVVPARLGIQTVLGLNSVRDAHRIALAQRSAVPQCPGFSRAPTAMCLSSCAPHMMFLSMVARIQSDGGLHALGRSRGAERLQSFAVGRRDPKITICAMTVGDSNPPLCSSGANSVQFVEFDPKAGNKDTSGLGETAMDIEYAHGIAPGIHMKYFLGGDGSDADLVAAMSAAEQDKAST